MDVTGQHWVVNFTQSLGDTSAARTLDPWFTATLYPGAVQQKSQMWPRSQGEPYLHMENTTFINDDLNAVTSKQYVLHFFFFNHDI